MRKHRLFIGIQIPKEIQEKLKKIQKELEKKRLPLRFVDVEKIHVTLNFLGHLSDKDVVEVRHILDNLLPSFSPFDISLTSFRFFPDENRIRVVALMIESEGYLEKLQKAISDELSRLKSVLVEKREFKPHITIARARDLGIKTKEIEEIKNIEIETAKWQVDSIELIESVLSRKGAKYTILKKWSLER